ncbi:MAG: ribonucleotide-diphosphate reductase subunit alpha, partial [Gluconacetobacter diazotrophicus]|nr:ribonucleotide-diphosphate reductase subunit alpha [Gluconacetobacter diazotrophicus]
MTLQETDSDSAATGESDTIAIDPRQGSMLDVVQMEGRHPVRVDRARDALLTDFGKATLDNRYLMPGESYQDLFARVSSYY